MRYFINGKEITAEQAAEQERRNAEIMQINNLEKWLDAAKDIRFIVMIEGGQKA